MSKRACQHAIDGRVLEARHKAEAERGDVDPPALLASHDQLGRVLVQFRVIVPQQPLKVRDAERELLQTLLNAKDCWQHMIKPHVM